MLSRLFVRRSAFSLRGALRLAGAHSVRRGHIGRGRRIAKRETDAACLGYSGRSDHNLHCVHTNISPPVFPRSPCCVCRCFPQTANITAPEHRHTSDGQGNPVCSTPPWKSTISAFLLLRNGIRWHLYAPLSCTSVFLVPSPALFLSPHHFRNRGVQPSQSSFTPHIFRSHDRYVGSIATSLMYRPSTIIFHTTAVLHNLSRTPSSRRSSSTHLPQLVRYRCSHISLSSRLHFHTRFSQLR